MVAVSYTTPGINDIPVSMQTPLPVAIYPTPPSAGSPMLFTQSPSMAASLVLKSGPGTLFSCYATTNTASGYLMLFDAVNIPADGTVSPRDVVFCGASSTSGVDQTDTPEPFQLGIIAVFSSTGPYVKTALAGAFIKGVAA